MHITNLIELIFADINEVKSVKVFLNVHDDFELNLCKTEFNGNLVFNIKNKETRNDYLYTLDFSSKETMWNHIVSVQELYISY